MALTRKTKSSRSDDAAPLLQHDSLAESFGDQQDGFDMIELSDADLGSGPSLSKQVTGLKMAGRSALADGKGLGARRRDDLASGVKDMGKAGALLGADALLPGLGSGLGAADSVMAIRGAAKDGKGMGMETAKQVGMTGAGLIPVIGQFVGFAEGLYKSCKATMQPGKSRTAEKLEAAQKLRSECAGAMARIADLRDQLSAYDGADRAKLSGRLDKAERRLETALEMADAWMAKKSDRGTLPLLADDDSGGSSDASAAFG